MWCEWHHGLLKQDVTETLMKDTQAVYCAAPLSLLQNLEAVFLVVIGCRAVRVHQLCAIFKLFNELIKPFC